jgi:hypothetical protein
MRRSGKMLAGLTAATVVLLVGVATTRARLDTGSPRRPLRSRTQRRLARTIRTSCPPSRPPTRATATGTGATAR